MKNKIMNKFFTLKNNYKKTVKNFSNNPKVKIIREYSVNATKMFDDKLF